MASNSGFAEIGIEDGSQRLYGALVQMSQEGALIRLERAPSSARAGPVPSGSSASLTIVTGSAMFTATARIVSESAGDIAIVFNSSLHKEQLRSEERYACELSVMYRARHTDSRAGAWRTGSTYEVSVGGFCMKADRCVEESKLFEVCFVLPNDEEQAPVRSEARIAYQRAWADGKVAVGFDFTSISARDKMRILRFMN